jgi:hypothetical protein
MTALCASDVNGELLTEPHAFSKSIRSYTGKFWR